ncbi:efflux RND transporter periplasmic adaptor subunit [Sedimentitalea sp. XS_ASV28]|uniref:efflux RND transporter periplasmic adaptor subunit n=1 Tax=Sedimentitalea sp. XS_ASV28 TaxID=3241296 RepID=UPI003511D37C
MTDILRGLIAGLAILIAPVAALAETPIVKLITVPTGETGTKRVFFGRVVARETVDLAFQVGGQIVEFPVEEGAMIAQGSVVAKLDQIPFTLARDEAQARSVQAHRTLERYQKLLGSAVTETAVQDEETAVELADLALRNAERALSQATLNAPFDSIVATRLVPNFSTISAGTPVVRLHDLSDLRIEIDVPETLFQRAGSAAKVNLHAEFPAVPGSFPLELREFNAETEQIGQTYKITLGMAPPEGEPILPGSSAKVTAVLYLGAPRIEIPLSAIDIGNDSGTSVMVFTPTGANEGTVTRTPVEIGATNNGTVELLSGVEPGQEIVAIGANALKDGATVRRFAGFGN